ncbi:MAG: hypothetical protein COU11_02355 [Candidatus Harrisonbacteria bacterium CG10_big_fil_rev_8_21_14_0_10_49_15]|uniref:FAD/NAD(P)-binding domain-containing protein n=1 Tax=Candidatus Harrisonbacteria bacterium CG10_big_fil_rev_8_21_14_0_10_49_15 TaxID=1974587 RepID=A0A2H0UKW7_9BACT|nr:MAG: hypothetical protein COU11_02355 [Candidatus Harrisonbacteria bacterium CG10_big_fil_rev_8_21_14_0_10_49_15]
MDLEDQGNQYEVVIIGAGPAALTAGIFLGRANIRVLIIGRLEASGLADASVVANWPGIPEGIGGRELLERMLMQAKQHGAEFVEEDVVHLESIENSEVVRAHFHAQRKNDLLISGGFLVRTASREDYFAQKLLLAHGANYIKTDLPGEVELVGKGVHYCVLCDGAVYKDKPVIVLGNGNLAAEEALQLAAFTKDITLISHSIKFSINEQYQKLLEEKGVKMQIGKVEGFEKEERGVKLLVRLPEESLPSEETPLADGVFVALGVASSMVFAKKLGLEEKNGFLKVNPDMTTNVPGVWGAGLSRGGVNQAIKSAGEGSVAAVGIIKELKGVVQYMDHT